VIGKYFFKGETKRELLAQGLLLELYNNGSVAISNDYELIIYIIISIKYLVRREDQ